MSDIEQVHETKDDEAEDVTPTTVLDERHRLSNAFTDSAPPKEIRMTATLRVVGNGRCISWETGTSGGRTFGGRETWEEAVDSALETLRFYFLHSEGRARRGEK